MPGPTVTLTPNCGPPYPIGFGVHPEITGFPPNSFLHIDLLKPDGSIWFVSGVTVDANGNHIPPPHDYFGMFAPPGVYTYR